jgi:hypothetical protein
MDQLWAALQQWGHADGQGGLLISRPMAGISKIKNTRSRTSASCLPVGANRFC